MLVPVKKISLSESKWRHIFEISFHETIKRDCKLLKGKGFQRTETTQMTEIIKGFTINLHNKKARGKAVLGLVN